MSTLRHGDEDMHYSDNSHTWIAPPGVDQDLWESRVRAHLEDHLMTMGGPGDEGAREGRVLRIPSQRRPSEPARRWPKPRAAVSFRPRSG